MLPSGRNADGMLTARRGVQHVHEGADGCMCIRDARFRWSLLLPSVYNAGHLQAMRPRHLSCEREGEAQPV